MFKKLFVVGLLASSTIALGAGCAAQTDDSDDGVVDEAALSAAGQALIGSYKDDTGPFRGLILTSTKVGQANEFIADVDTGVRCVVAPCPSSERIKGTFTAGSKTITFRSTTASNFAKHLLSRYNYLVQGSKFSLTRKNFAQSLENVNSYCSVVSDCDVQGIIHPMCVGSFTCSAQNTCSYQCGLHPINPCAGLDLDQCMANNLCQPKFGPSACSPNGICTADMAYKGCNPRETGGTCMSSASCAAGEHCSVEDGVCNPTGMLAVCSGTCVAGAPNQ